MSNEVEERNKLFSAMNTGTPFKSYKKAILARVFVYYWDSFREEPSSTLLTGDPRRNDESCIIDVWSEQEDVFFKRMNRAHLSNGTLLPYQRPVEIEHVRTFEESTDEELTTFLGSKYFTIQNKLNHVNTLPVLFRLVEIARQHDKSEKIIKLIEGRIAEIQSAEYAPERSTEPNT